MAAALLAAAQARASLFDINFAGIDGTTVAYGTLDGTETSPGVYDATAGFLTITPGSTSGLTAGNYALLVNPSYPGAPDSPSGYFFYDNAVLAQQNPFLDNAGLLFANGLEVNLFSVANTPPEYQIYDNSGANVLGTAYLTAVPEPTTIISGALMLLPFGASTMRILRKRVA